MRTREEIKYEFTPAGNLDQTRSMKMLKINNQFLDLALDVEDLVPNCPDRTAALRKIMEAKFTCVQAITHFRSPDQPVQSTISTQLPQEPNEKPQKFDKEKEIDLAKEVPPTNAKSPKQ